MLMGMVQITIIADNPQIAQAVERLIVHGGFDAVCTVGARDGEVLRLWVGGQPPADAPRANVFETGAYLRLGAVIDRVAFLVAGLQSDRKVVVGPYRLLCGQNILRRAGVDMMVTDTEKRLLCALADAGHNGVSREDLLAQVWGYRPDIDTHTVETHIYRLRQKIEADPSVPQILVKAGAGYCLRDG
jgi:hypothetical protein